jgi:hypothetical protein
MAIGAASSIAEFASQRQAADDQNKMAEQNRINALAAFENTQRSMNERIMQERESADLDKFDTALETRSVQATSNVAAGESGISGMSVDALSRDIVGRQARFNERVDQQTGWNVSHLEGQKREQSARTLDRISQTPRAKAPSFIGAGLRIAASAVNAYNQSKKLNS